MVRIILTADRAVFTDFNGSEALGFGLCVPFRLIPAFVEYRILAPPVPVDSYGRARYAPYPLAKVEAALVAGGFRREDVAVVPPEHLRSVVGKDTEILAVHVLDPQGLAPVSWTLEVLTGGGKPCTQYEFERLMTLVRELKRKYGFKVVVGGPGAWQLRGLEDKFGIDVLYEGEAELTFPKIAWRILRGEDMPKHVVGEQPPPSSIPPIITPSRNGVVEVTRGCPRRCHFCSPTMRFFRTIPLSTVLKEVELNLRRGVSAVSFATEDIMLYGAEGLNFKPEAVRKLFTSVLKVSRKYGVLKVGFSHVSLSSALVMKDTVRFITDINNLTDSEPMFPQVGLESGSPRMVRKYFGGKPYPWRPEEWPEVVVDGVKLLNENYWYPCLTYIIGFPDATPDDYVKTTELLDRLKSEGFRGWVFPLFLIPMGGTLIEGRARFKVLRDLPPEALECITAGWRMSLEFSKEIYPKLLNAVNGKLTRRIIQALVSKALGVLEGWIDTLSKNTSLIETEFSKINLRSVPSLLTTLIKAGLSAL